MNAQQNTFTKVINQSNNDGLQATSAAKVLNGDFIIGANGNNNYGVLIKIDNLGNIIWNKKFEAASNYIKIKDLITTADSCYILTGEIANNGNNDAILIKTDTSGNIIWSESYSCGTSLEINTIIETLDSDLVIIGNTNEAEPKLFISRLGKDGNILWSKQFFQTGNKFYGKSITVTPDSNFVLIGNFTDNQSISNPFLIKMNSSGNVFWTKTITNQYVNCGYDVISESDGFISHFYINTNIAIVKYDYDGNELWSRYYYGNYAFMSNNPIQRIHKTHDHGYIIANGSDWNTFLFKIDSVGNAQWIRDLLLRGFETIETDNNELLTFGNGPLFALLKDLRYVHWNIGLIQTDSLGYSNDCNNSAYIYTDTDSLTYSSITLNSLSGGYITTHQLTVSVDSIYSDKDCVDFAGNIDNTEQTSIEVFPNPAGKEITVKADIIKQVEFMDSKGKILIKKDINSDEYAFDTGNYSKGVYYIRVISDKGIRIVKVILN
ncbi:MAG: hypothetical protein Kow0068_23230 [Marinilabiliales bacterium]